MSEIELMRQIGENIRDLMGDWNMSQKELADRTGISEATISYYINGERMPSVKNLVNIAYVLECDLTEIVEAYELIF